MTDELRQAKQPLSAALAGPYGHPFHPLLVALPIGSWLASLVFDIGSHIVSSPGFLTQGSIWLIAIGVISALVAAATGFLDLLGIPLDTPAFRTGLLHMALNLLITTAYVGNFFLRYASYGRAGSVAAVPLALSAVSLGALAVSGYLGGKLAFRYGVRVADEGTQIEGFQNAGSSAPGRSRSAR